jgi:HK97 gp10 family phage protein
VSEAIKIEGLNEFVRNLKKLDTDLPKAVRKAFNTAADVVVDDARPSIPKRTGKAQASVRAQSTQTEARVKGGGKKAPWYPWLDFGGRVGRKKSVKRAFLKEGRYIYAAYFKNRDSGKFEEVMTGALVAVVEGAGIGVD